MSLVFLSLLACDHTGFGFRPEITDAPSLLDLGELTPLSLNDWSVNPDPLGYPASIVYSEVGADADPGKVTGASAHFKGTGTHICLVLDPEAVYWSRSMASTGPGRYKYDDDFADDGDIDMDAGLTAFYTGSPGVEIGDFAANYTDDAGVNHAIQFNECIQTGYGGAPNVHSGRATTESCTVDTDQEIGIDYTIALRTFSLPLNDSKLGFAVGVFDVGEATSCGDVFKTATADECLFVNEGTLGERNDRTDVEEAFCNGTGALNTYCGEHLEDDSPPCKEPSQTHDPGTGTVVTGA